MTIIPFKGKRLRDQPRVIAAELQLARFIRSSQPDIVHAHLFKAVLCCRLATIGYPRALRVAQLPGMVHLDSMPGRWLDRWTLAGDDLIIGSCQAIAERYRVMGARAVAVSYYGLDVRKFDPRTSGAGFRREFGLADDTPAVGMVAHMYPTNMRAYRKNGVKGHEVFLDAVPLILQQVPGARIFVVGDEFAGNGDYRRRLEARAAALGLSTSVHFTGHRSDIASVMAGLDVAVNPSLQDSACGTMVQALLMETGVVASNVGGLPDTVQDGETGLLVPPADPVALAAAVTKLLTDPVLRLEMANRGRERCLRRFEIGATVAEVEKLYWHALHNSTRVKRARRPHRGRPAA